MSISLNNYYDIKQDNYFDFQEAFDGLFPRDDPSNTRFSINYFTAIGNFQIQ